MGYSFLGQTDWPAKQTLERISGKYGGRLTSFAGRDCADLRRSVLRIKDSYDFRWLMGWLRKPKNCEPSIYSDLTRTPSMQARLVTVGLVKKPAEENVKPRSRS